MQREIKKRAYVYGFAAVLLAILLGSLCYNLGVNPQYEGPTQPTPPIEPTPTEPSLTPSLTALKTFSSLDELRSFLSNSSAFIFYGPLDFEILGIYPLGPEVRTANVEYSTTNVQVAGVDEADIVKTEEGYIYVASGNNVYILKAYPLEEAELVSKITYNDTYLVGIFVSRDRLAVLGCEYFIPLKFPYEYFEYYCLNMKTFIDLYDISNKTNPLFLKNFTISGSYFNARMIGDYVYFVVSEPAYLINDTVILPKIYAKEGIKEIGATQIYYYNASDEYYLYTTVVAFNMQNVTEEATYKTIMLGETSCMYVSLNNVYITFQENYQNTTIYRIRIENNTIIPEAVGSVLGHPLNQFSMDEYNGYYRIATMAWINGTPQNNLYVLDMNLSITGKLENFAPPEEVMDSARFIEDRCYLSTSTPRKDPFFVIDVKNVSEPKILGNLSIPGFTRYLHPYDENHIIGLGMDGSNVKISIYDVSNVTAPKNITEHKIDGYWSYTLALTEHKAFLFDKAKELLVIPVTVYYQDPHLEYNFLPWYGVYVFKINLDEGLALRGNITQQENDAYYYITRALYINNILYTVSEAKVQMNSLIDLEFIGEIKLR